ncbi:MAG: hypothetical protein JNM69_06720 [Archangium sp.]|nr:hypothetical protein [Archangium sp.]
MAPVFDQVVRFEHRRPRPGVLPAAVAGAGSLTGGISRRTTIARGVLVVSGAAALAWVTQRSGQPLGAGLCAFFGALPLLWFAGWVVGALFSVRAAARAAAKTMERIDWQKAIDENTIAEQVTLQVLETGLQVSREPQGASSSSELFGWQRVQFERHGHHMAFIGLEAGEPLSVPATAFSDGAAFDAFCLSVQGQVWEAQRRSGA